MPTASVLIDSNLLVLLLVGRVGPEIILRHRRLAGYEPSDFTALEELIGEYERVLVTPNTLTEASNLLALHGQPERQDLLNELGTLIADAEEIFVTSATAAARPDFGRFGLTDAVLLEAASANSPVLTVDQPLFAAALAKQAGAALYFVKQSAM